METVEYGLCHRARPCRLLLGEGLTGRDVENTGERLFRDGGAFATFGQKTHGRCILCLRQTCLCWMPQLLPALCLPEPSAASSHSLSTPEAFYSPVLSFQRPHLLLQKTPAMIGGSDHSTCPSTPSGTGIISSQETGRGAVSIHHGCCLLPTQSTHLHQLPGKYFSHRLGLVLDSFCIEVTEGEE